MTTSSYRAGTLRPDPDAPPSVTRARVRLLAVVFMGLAHLTVLRLRLKGVALALVEVAFLLALPTLLSRVIGLVTLGTPQPDLPVKERDNSLFMLIDGVVAIAVIAVFAVTYVVSVRSALADHRQSAEQRHSVKSQLSTIGSRAFPMLGLAPTVGFILFFVVVPLVFSALVAFTNYSAPRHIPPANTVDWVGMDNFVTMFGGNAIWTGALGRVFLWTVVWATLAVATSYVGGLILAVVLHESKIRIKPFYRAIFILPYAVPAVVTMLVWRNMLNGAFGAVNKTLMGIGIIDSPIPWLSDPWLAKFVVVGINLWAAFPYFMLLTMSAMTAISQDVQEAAELDGCSRWQRFRFITSPLVFFQTAPLLLMSFAANFNNFGAIFFLTGGGPNVADTTTTAAGATDILVTWIYGLTVEQRQYHFASVLAILIFLVLAPFAIINLRRTKAFKGEL